MCTNNNITNQDQSRHEGNLISNIFIDSYRPDFTGNVTKLNIMGLLGCVLPLHLYLFLQYLRYKTGIFVELIQFEEREFSGSEVRWLVGYFTSSWITNFGHGLVVTVVGPTQLYIAQNVGVEKDTINLLWTFGFFGFLVGSFASGFLFKR